MARSMTVSGLAEALAARGVSSEDIAPIVKQTRHPKVFKRLSVGRLRAALDERKDRYPKAAAEVNEIIKYASSKLVQIDVIVGQQIPSTGLSNLRDGSKD